MGLGRRGGSTGGGHTRRGPGAAHTAALLEGGRCGRRAQPWLGTRGADAGVLAL